MRLRNPSTTRSGGRHRSWELQMPFKILRRNSNIVCLSNQDNVMAFSWVFAEGKPLLWVDLYKTFGWNQFEPFENMKESVNGDNCVKKVEIKAKKPFSIRCFKTSTQVNLAFSCSILSCKSFLLALDIKI